MLLQTLTESGFFNPFHEIDGLEKEIRGIFNGRTFGGHSELNIYKFGEDSVKVVAFLPGVDAEKLDVTVEGDRLTIAGSFAEKDEGSCHLRERKCGDFSKIVKLPFRAKAEDMTAGYGKGILSITVNRDDEDKPKTIKVDVQ